MGHSAFCEDGRYRFNRYRPLEGHRVVYVGDNQYRRAGQVKSTLAPTLTHRQVFGMFASKGHPLKGAAESKAVAKSWFLFPLTRRVRDIAQRFPKYAGRHESF